MEKLTDNDRAALQRAIDLCCAESERERQRIEGELASGKDWFDTASGCSFHRQMVSLGLTYQPWRSPPMHGHIERPRRDQPAFNLLQRMLALGVSKFEPNPLFAVAEAEAKARLAETAK